MKGLKKEGLRVWRVVWATLWVMLLPVQGVVASVTVSTLAGSVFGFFDSAGVSAQFKYPTGVAVDSAGTVYVADQSNHRIRMIQPDGAVSTLAGSGTAGFADGVGTAAQFSLPFGVAVDSAGTVYVADTYNHRIRKILPDGTVSTLSGSGTPGFADGVGTAAQFYYPTGVAVDSAGTVYVADLSNNRIRKVKPDGTVSTLAGSGAAGFADGAGLTAQFNKPTGVAVDSAGTVYVADSNNNRIRKVRPDGMVSTLAGSGTQGFLDAVGVAAKFAHPNGVAVDSTGTVYVADKFNKRIRKVQPNGTVSTLAGTGTLGFADGAGAASQFNFPTGVAIGSTGTVYVADQSNQRIRKITIQSHPSDFDGDGLSDILWRNTTDGSTVIWSSVSGGSLGTVPLVFKIVGVGDFDGDGKSDILWRNTTDGRVVLWMMNGASIASGGSLGTVPLAYTIAGVADYNGDGKSDILWRNTDGSTVVWLMNGKTLVAGASLGVVPGNWSVRP